MGEIVDILAVFPLGHALVVMASFVLLPHPVRVADEESTDLVLFAEVNDLPRPFMAQVAHAPLDATRHRVPGALQFPPAARVLLAARLSSGNLPVSHVALALEAADTAT